LGNLGLVAFLLIGAVAALLVAYYFATLPPDTQDSSSNEDTSPARTYSAEADRPTDRGDPGWHRLPDAQPTEQPAITIVQEDDGGIWPQTADQSSVADESTQAEDQADQTDQAYQADLPDSIIQPGPALALADPIRVKVDYSPVDRTTVEPVFGLAGHVTKNYVIYSKLDREVTYDVARRLEALYDYYADRFSDVYSPIDFPMLVFLFNDRESFVAAGGHPIMPGQFMGGNDDDVGARLMMIIHDQYTESFVTSCSLMYHEAFHQFKAIEISQAGNINRQWPLWLDEAYATTFNNIVWTGDGWVDGIIRLEYAESATDCASAFLSLRELMDITGEQWHEKTNRGTIWPVYMEGMSLIYFLNHAENSKYRSLLADYVEQVSTGQDASASQRRILALESRFNRWVSDHMNTYVTGAKYYEILTAMVTSHLARAHANGQRFESGEDFLTKAQTGQLKLPPLGSQQWLPDSLRKEMLYYHKTLTENNQPFALDIEYPAGGGKPIVRVVQPRFGLVLEGRFNLDANGKVADVEVKYIKCPSIDLREAKKIVAAED